jgi:hypothetical protein
VSRREFKRDVRIAIIKRSMINGVPTCEFVDENEVRCICQKGLELNHDDMDAMQIDKSRKLTIDDGHMLCKPHHTAITKKQRKDLARVQAAEARHLGDKDPRKQKVPNRGKAPRSTSKLDSIRALGPTLIGRAAR